MHVAVCPAEGDLEDLVQLVKGEIWGQGESAGDCWVEGEGHGD